MTERLDVAPQDWLAEARRIRAAGATWFDWLTGVDDGDGVLVRARVAQVGGAAYLLATRVPDGDALDSLTTVWRGAAWAERETAEMLGVRFVGFEDGSGLGVRPLLLATDVDGYPLRAGFPLVARGLVPWPGLKEPGESAPAPGRRRIQAPDVPEAHKETRR